MPRCAKTGHDEAKTGYMAERAQLAILKMFIGTISYSLCLDFKVSFFGVIFNDFSMIRNDRFFEIQ